MIWLGWGASYRCIGEITRNQVAILCVEAVAAGYPKGGTAPGPWWLGELGSQCPRRLHLCPLAQHWAASVGLPSEFAESIE